MVLVHTKGWQRSFRLSTKARILALSPWTDVNVPRWMACFSMMPDQTSSGSPGALLPRGTLRIGRARFPSNRLRQALKAVHR